MDITICHLCHGWLCILRHIQAKLVVVQLTDMRGLSNSASKYMSSLLGCFGLLSELYEWTFNAEVIEFITM